MGNVADVICDLCIEQLALVSEDICPKCGTPLEEDGCPACADTEFRFAIARAAWMFSGPVQVMIHKLKYDQYLSPVPFLARGMHYILQSEPVFAGADLITCVPLHHTRKRERTFNQSELLGRALAAQSGIAYSELLRRHSYTHSQTKLSKTQRRANLHGAFSLRSKAQVSGRKVILVDDVFTTGSTVNEAAGVLLDAGAAEVFVLTAARAG